ncbi:MAG: HlyD family secretion protein [Gammaproteobacteria bacterium]|nr:HlyD family secretion protein [Gammaproteobacteria bacterium]
MTEQNEITENTPDPVRRVTRYLMIIIVILFIWYVASDRIAPWTDQARVQAYVIPIVPQVSGRVIEVNVVKDEVVAPGHVLLKIDPSDYELAVQAAEAALELAGQEIGAGTATVTTAQAKLVEAITNLEHARTQSARVFELEKKNVMSKAEGDKARAVVKQAEAQVDSARAELEKARQALGVQGEANPRIRSAIADLKQAQLDLSRTTILAPSKGGITNLQVEEGYYASAGVPLMTFIEFDNVWIQANMRENNIANIEPGDSVDIALDVAPGKVFKGKVSSVGFAVGSDHANQVGGLVTVESKSGWLRDAQRFPVIIVFDDERAYGLRRLGGQADVLVYTGNNWIINPLGWLYIRLLSLFSYVY